MNVYGHVDRRGERVTQLGVSEGCSWVKVHQRGVDRSQKVAVRSTQPHWVSCRMIHSTNQMMLRRHLSRQYGIAEAKGTWVKRKEKQSLVLIYHDRGRERAIQMDGRTEAHIFKLLYKFLP